MFGGVTREAPEPMLITLPPREPKYFTASRVAKIRPRTFVLKCRWKCSSVISSSGAKSIDSGVVHQDIEWPERAVGVGEHSLDVTGL